MTTLQRIQKELKTWQAHNFPDRTAVNLLLGIGEEVGELNHHFLKRMQGIRLNEDHNAGIKDSVADIVILLLDFCNAEGFDLETELVETWNKVKQRDWQKNKNTGITDSADALFRDIPKELEPLTYCQICHERLTMCQCRRENKLL